MGVFGRQTICATKPTLLITKTHFPANFISLHCGTSRRHDDQTTTNFMQHSIFTLIIEGYFRFYDHFCRFKQFVPHIQPYHNTAYAFPYTLHKHSLCKICRYCNQETTNSTNVKPQGVFWVPCDLLAYQMACASYSTLS